MQYMPVYKKIIPYKADFRLEGTTFTFSFFYNSSGDYFTVDLEQNGEVLAVGEKVVYGSPLFITYLDDRFPLRAIVPFDLSEECERVGWRELEEDVFLYVLEAGDFVEA